MLSSPSALTVSTRPVWTVNPTAKLKDTANTEAPQLSFQRKAVQESHSQQANKNNPPPAPSTPDIDLHAPSSVSVGLSPRNKRSNLSINDSNGEDEIVDLSVPSKKKHAITTMAQAKRKSVTLGNPHVTDANGLLIDVDVQFINNNTSTCEDKRQDVDHFIRPAVDKDVNGKAKKACKLCP
ncbi:hypothetical protein F5148DRAFT_1146538 [Russula earlei]|uniref:Uncharacterized protein n=1 Tax=Russula earlei TaxID=71964 RepID=A0ACC0UJY7_9AGAM|nr:hypothetical protein F5148DRAFT_1146538 [Russula earlei]